MKTRTVIEIVGENMGPIDWSYDFRQHFDIYCTDDAGKQRECDRHVERLRKIDEALKAGKEVQATTYGGWPRCGYYRVVETGMYDGWPYWKPVPSVCVQGTFGREWYTFSIITNIILDGVEQ